MKLPVHTTSGPAQPPASQVRAMARAVQANLVQLKVVESKRRGVSSDLHHIKVPAPGFVRDFRETLIDSATLAEYCDEHLQLRLREIWGQFCMMLWLFSYADSPEQADFSALSAEAEMRCGPAVEIKHDEVHAILWLLRFEQRRRSDTDYARSPEFAEHHRLSRQIPGQAFGKALVDCTDIELLHAACEYAGMLAAIRWVLGRVPAWADPTAMTVAERPF